MNITNEEADRFAIWNILATLNEIWKKTRRIISLLIELIMKIEKTV